MMTFEERRAVSEEAIRKAEVKHLLANRTWFVGLGPKRTGTAVFYYPDEGGEGVLVDNVIADLMVEQEESKKRHEFMLAQLMKAGGIVPGVGLDLWEFLKSENKRLAAERDEWKRRAEEAEGKLRPEPSPADPTA